MLRWLWLTAAVVVLDLLTKQWASAQLLYAQPLEVTGFFNLTLLHNTGAAFSFLGEAGGWQRWLFAVIAVGASIAMGIWLMRLQPHERLSAIGLALIIGGAVGNLWDRVTLGYVVDFLDFHLGGRHWPAFNIADIGISLGAVLLIIDSFRHAPDDQIRDQ